MSRSDGSQPRSVLVAGGTSGINLAIARTFAAAGCRVAVLSRDPDKVAAAQDELSAAGAASARGASADVRDAGAVEGFLSTLAQDWGSIDVIVSGAAGNFVAPAAEMSPNAFKSVIDIDLLGSFNVARAAWPHLTKPGACLVFITAAQSWLPTPGQAHVGAAKAGIDQLTRTLALEWGSAGVRVNAVAPGPISGTEGMRRLAPTPEAEAAWTQAVPLGRFGETGDITEAVQWLCSESAAYVTGVVLPVDGGLSLGGSSAITQAIRS